MKCEYGIDISNEEPGGRYDIIILAVSHSNYTDKGLRGMLKPGGMLYDVKGVLPKGEVDERL